MATVSRTNGMDSNPNNSKLKNMDEIGQFVTPQKTAAIPQAAASAGDRPVICPNRHPKVAPTNNVGTISPPRNPHPNVTAVNMIFNKNADAATFPSMTARSTTSIPAPR